MAKKPSFEERLRTLEKIVRDLEDGDGALEKLVEVYKSGVKLRNELKDELDRMEKTVEALSADGALEPIPELDTERGDA